MSMAGDACTMSEQARGALPHRLVNERGPHNMFDETVALGGDPSGWSVFCTQRPPELDAQP